VAGAKGVAVAVIATMTKGVAVAVLADMSKTCAAFAAVDGIAAKATGLLVVTVGRQEALLLYRGRHSVNAFQF
jgi:hypothetical protein